MEEEARTLRRAALAEDETKGENLVDAIRARFAKLGGVELELPPREPMREPAQPPLMCVAARNIADFEGCGIKIVDNPWAE